MAFMSKGKARPEDRPLLRELIDIPERVSTSDYVLKLNEAVTPEGAGAALNDYVVTDRLKTNFEDALSLIKSAVDGQSSKAAYLHGSFGSGKSHFMAVLYALLSGHQAVRSREEFDGVRAKHTWLDEDGRRFLLVPYHMLSAKSLEQRVLGKYVDHVHRLHPEAPLPQVYRTDGLFEDFAQQRRLNGDAKVIEQLSRATVPRTTVEIADDEGWGDLVSAEDSAFRWTSPSSTPPSPRQRSTRTPRGSTSTTPPPRRSCAPASYRTSRRPSSPPSPAMPPRTRTGSSPSTRGSASSPSMPSPSDTTA